MKICSPRFQNLAYPYYRQELILQKRVIICTNIILKPSISDMTRNMKLKLDSSHKTEMSYILKKSSNYQFIDKFHKEHEKLNLLFKKR